MLGFCRKYKQRIKELEQQIEHVTRALEASMLGIVSIDQDYRVRFINRRVIEYTKMTHKDILGKPIGETLFAPNYFRRVVKPALAEAQHRKEYELELTARRADDTELPLWVKITAPTTASSHKGFMGSVITARDITKQKKQETELLENKDELERLNALMLDREIKMVELKKKIKELEVRT